MQLQEDLRKEGLTAHQDTPDAPINIEREVLDRVLSLQRATREELEQTLSVPEKINSGTAEAILRSFQEVGSNVATIEQIRTQFEADQEVHKLATDFSIIFVQTCIPSLKRLGYRIATTNFIAKDKAGHRSPKSTVELQNTSIKILDNISPTLQALHQKASDTAEILEKPENQELVKTLAFQYAGVRFTELAKFYDGDLATLIDETNDSLKIVDNNLKIHVRNGIVILGPQNQEEHLIAANCEEVYGKAAQALRTSPIKKADETPKPAAQATTAPPEAVADPIIPPIERNTKITFTERLRGAPEAFPSNRTHQILAFKLVTVSDRGDTPISQLALAAIIGTTEDKIVENLPSVNEGFAKIGIKIETFNLSQGPHYRLAWIRKAQTAAVSKPTPPPKGPAQPQGPQQGIQALTEKEFSETTELNGAIIRAIMESSDANMDLTVNGARHIASLLRSARIAPGLRRSAEKYASLLTTAASRGKHGKVVQRDLNELLKGLQ